MGQVINLAALKDKMRQSADLVDFGGIKVNRNQVPAMITAQAMSRFRRGQGTREDLKIELARSKQGWEKLAVEAKTAGDWAKANELARKAVALDNQIAALNTMSQNYPDADIKDIPGSLQAAAGLSPQSRISTDEVKGVMTEAQAEGMIKDAFLPKGKFGAIIDRMGQGARARALVLSWAKKDPLWDAGDRMSAGNNAIIMMQQEVDDWRDRKLIDPIKANKDFKKIFGFVPTK